MKKKLMMFLTVMLALNLSVFGQAREKRRGKYLRTEIKNTEKRSDFSVSLEKSQLGMCTLKFRRRNILSHHEVRIYEMLVEIVRENAGEGITERGAVEYVLVPDEVYEGEESVREEIEDAGPLGDCALTLLLGGAKWDIQTDREGIYIDSSQRILEKFDDLSKKNMDLKVVHSDYGDRTLSLTRNLIKRETATIPDADKAAPLDILETLGQDYTQLRQSSVDGLKLSAISPKNGKAGDVIAITVEAVNDGTKPVCNLLGRSFSSVAGLSGKMFYFGSIQPGEKKTFTRLVRLPEDKSGICYVAVGYWTILGTVQNGESRISVEVEK